MQKKLGVVADDLTGASDIASAMVGTGARVELVVGVPVSPIPDVDVVVVALKIRSAPIHEAVEQSLASARALRASGYQQGYFKYSSTFDSGLHGNIGPVADSLADLFGQRVVVVTPAFPRLHRAVINGRLVVDGRELVEADLGEHPLTPRKRSSVVEALRYQTHSGVGSIDLSVVREGAASVAESLEELARRGIRFAVVDGETERDLAILAKAVSEDVLITGATGLAEAIGGLRFGGRPAETSFRPPGEGPPVIMCGSCSSATVRQVRGYIQVAPSYRVRVEDLSERGVAKAVDWVARGGFTQAPLIYSTPTEAGTEIAPGHTEEFEAFFGAVARRLRSLGRERFVVAGGETSGAVVEALGCRRFTVGPEISPGVPWLVDEEGTLLALKSGNFGDDGFFLRAADPDHPR